MIYPLLPAFLFSIGGSAATLGWIEGVSEGVSAALKLLSGRIADRARSRKPLIAVGYGVAALARPFYALASAPAHAVLIRMVDRIGKGLRGPPRDAMVADAVTRESRGRAFGFHRMMDNFGAVVGSLLAFVLLRFAGLSIRSLFVLSIVPGLLAVLVVLLFVRAPREARDARADDHKSEREREDKPQSATKPYPIAPALTEAPPLPGAAKRYLATLFVFSLAGSGDLFLLQRLKDLGLDLALVPIAWVSLQLTKGLFNLPGGVASDKLGRRRVLAIAWLLYAATYVGYAVASSWVVAWLLLGLYALYYGLAEGGQRALLAEYVPPAARGRAYGIQLALEGATVLVANVLFGLAYDRFGAEAAFLATAALALAASGLLVSFVPKPPPPSPAAA
jgi:MFS family permease